MFYFTILHFFCNLIYQIILLKHFSEMPQGPFGILKVSQRKKITICYQRQLNISGKFCSNTDRKTNSSLLLIIKFIYLMEFNLILMLTMYKMIFSRILFHKPFIIFQIHISLSLIFPFHKQAILGQNYFFLPNKCISSLCIFYHRQHKS